MNRYALILLLAVGCNKPAATTDPRPFEAAINDYLQSKGFGMKIASVERIDESVDRATVTCKMQEAEGTYAMNVRWEFSLRRNNDTWQVENHTTK